MYLISKFILTRIVEFKVVIKKRLKELFSISTITSLIDYMASRIMLKYHHVKKIALICFICIMAVTISACNSEEEDKVQMINESEISSIEVFDNIKRKYLPIISDAKSFHIFTEAFNNSKRENLKDYKLDMSTHKVNIWYGNSKGQTFSLWLREDVNDTFYQPHFKDPTYVYKVPDKYVEELQSILLIKK